MSIMSNTDRNFHEWNWRFEVKVSFCCCWQLAVYLCVSVWRLVNSGLNAQTREVCINILIKVKPDPPSAQLTENVVRYAIVCVSQCVYVCCASLTYNGLISMGPDLLPQWLIEVERLTCLAVSSTWRYVFFMPGLHILGHKELSA